MDKYLMYVRKSTEPLDRQKLSLPAQVRENKARFPHIPDIEVLEESHSAFTPEIRPVFNEMIRRFESGDAHGLIAWHPDRLSRNEIDGAKIVYLVRKGLIRDLKFANYTFEPTPEGIMMLQMALSQSQYSSSKLSLDVKRGNREKVQAGGLTFFPGQGYRHNMAAKTIEPDPERFGLIKRAWDLLLYSGLTPNRIRRIANEDWGYRTTERGTKLGKRPLSSSTLYKIFRNPIYAGFYIDKAGVRHNCSHKPMITESEFWKAQGLLGFPVRPRPRKAISAYAGNLIKCGECGCSITVDRKTKTLKNGRRLSWEYYRCTKKRGVCGQSYLEVKDLEDQVEAFLASILLPEEFFAWVRTNRNLLEPEAASWEKAERASVSRTLVEIDRELANLQAMRRKDFLSDQEFVRDRAALMEERARLLPTAEIRQPEKWLEPLSELENFSSRCLFWFRNGTVEMKKSIVLATAGSNLCLMDKKLRIQPVGPFAWDATKVGCAGWLGQARNIRTYFEDDPNLKLPALPPISVLPASSSKMQP